MFTKLYSSTLSGIFGYIVGVETDLTSGLHSFQIVGLPNKAVDEARQRVSAAVKNSGMLPPSRANKKVIVNLSPADMKKEGSGFDVAIALGYLLAAKQVLFDSQKKLFIGELALDGSIKRVAGVLPSVIEAKKGGFEEIYVPKDSEQEAALISGIRIFGCRSLSELIDHLEERSPIAPAPETNLSQYISRPQFDISISFIRGQEYAKYGLVLAAAGGHNLLMIGPPGAGKTLLAKALQPLLPQMASEEIIEVSSIWSVAGKTTNESAVITLRPFRSPHHTISEAAMIGGGNPLRPGEITLAHRGVLFCDEFPEFHRDVIESLRQPLEEGKIMVSRAHQAHIFPARFIFVAAQNPCPCGNYQDPQKLCTCPHSQVMKYQRKLSGPIGDRIDIHMTVPFLPPEDLLRAPAGEEEEKECRQKIGIARVIQAERFRKRGIFTNSEIGLKDINVYCKISADLEDVVLAYLKKHQLSGRSYHRILKLARTIADLEESDEIKLDHLAQAVRYRTTDSS